MYDGRLRLATVRVVRLRCRTVLPTHYRRHGFCLRGYVGGRASPRCHRHGGSDRPNGRADWGSAHANGDGYAHFDKDVHPDPHTHAHADSRSDPHADSDSLTNRVADTNADAATPDAHRTPQPNHDANRRRNGDRFCPTITNPNPDGLAL